MLSSPYGTSLGRMLPDPLTSEALADAMAEPDPDSPATATRMRRQHPPEVAAAALEQASLRLRARTKFGDAVAAMFFTADGLEQATRPVIAAHRAGRFRAAGARRVVDLGCGIGSDAMAFVRAGMAVLAVDRDPRTADVARANLRQLAEVGGRAEVITGDAEDLAAGLITTGDAIFLDPSRRTSAGRIWRTSDFTPGWDFVLGMLGAGIPAGVKLGPGIPHAEIPAGAEAEWISDRSETVEAGLWSGPETVAGRRSALIMPDHRLVTDPQASVETASLGDYVYEPDGAVIRAGAIATLARDLGAWLLDDQIAYLSCDRTNPTPYATGFKVTEVLPYKEKIMRGWLRDHHVGRLEIKKRGVQVDPAALRKRLRPVGDNAATVIIARTDAGTKALVCDRLPAIDGLASTERADSMSPPG